MFGVGEGRRRGVLLCEKGVSFMVGYIYVRYRKAKWRIYDLRAR